MIDCEKRMTRNGLDVATILLASVDEVIE